MHRSLLALVAAVLLGAPPLAAQATRDQARLVINVFGGYMSGTTLWQVRGQPVYDDNAGGTMVDSLTLTRSIRANPTAGVRAIFFPGDHLGYFGEAFLLGLGYDDSCARSHASGSARNAEVCESISRNASPASAVQVAGGLMYRFGGDQRISPYARVSAGAALSSRSPIAMTGSFSSPALDGASVDLDVYPEQGSSQIHPAFGLGVGFTAQLARGYQLRWEVRDNIVGSRTVTAPTAVDGVDPQTGYRFRHRWSIEAGFDVVLERRPGRRY